MLVHDHGQESERRRVPAGRIRDRAGDGGAAWRPQSSTKWTGANQLREAPARQSGDQRPRVRCCRGGACIVDGAWVAEPPARRHVFVMCESVGTVAAVSFRAAELMSLPPREGAQGATPERAGDAAPSSGDGAGDRRSGAPPLAESATGARQRNRRPDERRLATSATSPSMRAVAGATDPGTTHRHQRPRPMGSLPTSARQGAALLLGPRRADVGILARRWIETRRFRMGWRARAWP